ncbi:MAG: hypothetical protein AB7T07_11345 [Steroidobacteraceae bacterium]
MKKALLIIGLLALSASARSETCEQSFQTIGDPRNGLFFTGKVQLPNLSVQSALGQLQQFALDGGYEVGNELIAGNSGELSFTQTSNNPPLVIQAAADSSGLVSLAMKLARGQKAKAQDVQTEFCSILAKLKTGKEGEAIATAARARTGSGRIIDAKAEQLSAEIGKEVKKTLAPVASKGNLSRVLIGTGEYASSGEYAEAFAPLRAKYVGRKYQIDGQIYTLSRNSMTREMEINYLVTQKKGLLGVRQESGSNMLNFQITCIFASDQGKFFNALSEGNWVTLVGTVTNMQPGGMQLNDCRQAN